MHLNEEMIDKLIESASTVRDRAYAPYSRFLVGAALLAADGRIFSGCNVENASYGATICAERATVVQAVSAGCTDFTAICVVAGESDQVAPCGMCRQVLNEFNPDMAVIMAGTNKQYTLVSLKELFPCGFGRESLA